MQMAYIPSGSLGRQDGVDMENLCIAMVFWKISEGGKDCPRQTCLV